MNNRFKLFLENFFIYGLINVLDKIVPIIMLPIITRLITDASQFGKFDMFSTIVSFGSAIAILGVYDAMFREYFEKKDPEYKNKVTSTALVIVMISSIVLSIILYIFRYYISEWIIGDQNEVFIVTTAIFGVILSTFKTIIVAPTRMNNNRKVFLFSNLAFAIIYYVIAIYLISNGLGYKGMIYANLISALISLLFFIALNKKYFKLKRFEKSIALELLKMGLPLLPTFLIYWIFNSVSRITISKDLGLEQVGIFSVGAKIASVSNFIY